MQGKDSRRIIVVGGGVVGCATAYLLARTGFAVTIIERDQIGIHASANNAGNLNPLHGTPRELLPFTLASYRLHADIRAELIQLGCTGATADPVDRIHLAYDEADLAHLQETSALFDSVAGFSSRWLDARDLSQLEPRLHRDISVGLMTAGALSIDGYEFTLALADAARHLGASVVQSVVSGILIRAGSVSAVQTDVGPMPCDAVVFATGPWVAGPETWLGVEIAVEPIKGELLLMGLGHAPPVYDLTWRATCLYRRRGNELWLGGTMESCDFNVTPTASVQEFLLKSAAEILTDLGRASVLRHVAALRPVSRSNAPIAMIARGWENAYIANGGGSKGILLSVGIAKTICDLLTYGRSNFPHEQ